MPTTLRAQDTISDCKPIVDATEVAIDEGVDLPRELGHLKISETRDNEQAEAVSSPENPEKKKKKKKKSKTRATGFEEYYADAPLTSVEAQEEESLYSPNLPFIRRIYTAISKFMKRRRLNQKLVHYFNDYLAAGGIDNSQNNFMGNGFGSQSKSRAHSFIPSLYGNKSRWWAPNDPGWEIDFTGVAAGWLTNNVMSQFAEDHTSPAIRDCIMVVTSFLRYLMVHDVCNEYKQDILNAIDVCTRAETELPQSMECVSKFPGAWNTLLRVISTDKGHDETRSTPTTDAAAVISAISRRLEGGLPDGFDYSTFLNFGFFLLGKKNVSVGTEIKVAKRFTYDLEVCQIEKVPVRVLREQLGENYQAYPELCRVKFKHFLNETNVDIGDYKRSLGLPKGKEVMLLDANICQLLKPGMKMVALVYELDNGVKFVCCVYHVYPEFYIYLFQNMMRQYQPHEQGTKPPPSALTWSDE